METPAMHQPSAPPGPSRKKFVHVDVNRWTFTTGIQLGLRAAIGGSLSLALAQFLRLDFPVFAFIAAIITTDLDPAQSRTLGVRRLAATLVGGLCGATISSALPPSPLTLGLSILVAMLICQLLPIRDGARIAAYISGLIVFDQRVEPWHYATLRMVETAIGVAVAWLISYVPKLIRIPERG
jgi:uncharacterized membrane protein YgaE (UPF0421/DUF939 family)